MKRTPIIIPGQVYLHTEHNEYLVVSKSNRGDVQFIGPGFSGKNDAEVFLERVGPVDPIDLSDDERLQLEAFIPGVKLSIGWVQPEDDDGEEEEY